MKTFLAILFLVITFHLDAQQSRFDIRLGAGLSQLGKINMIAFENEVNFKVTRYFSSAISLNFSRSDFDAAVALSIIQGNANIYISPFKNNKKNDFRIGAGSYYSSMTSATPFYYGCATGVDFSREFYKKSNFGVNLIIEDTYSFTERFLVGIKLLKQSDSFIWTPTGIYLKLGIKI